MTHLGVRDYEWALIEPAAALDEIKGCTVWAIGRSQPMLFLITVIF